MAFDPSTAKAVKRGGFDPSSAKPVQLNPAPSLEEFQAQAPIADESQLVQAGRFAREHAPLIGSVAGGILGARAGPAGSLALGSLLGTSLGATIGTSAKQIARRALLGEGKEPKEALGEHVTNVTEQAMYDLMGQGIGKAASKTVEAASPLVREGAEMAQNLLRSKGGTLSAAQATESTGIALAESFARGGVGGKGHFAIMEKRNSDAMQAIKESLIKSLTESPVNDKATGSLFQNAMKGGSGAHSVASTALYTSFDSRAGKAVVDTTGLRAIGEEVASQFARIGNVGKSEAGGKLIDQVTKLPDQMTFADAHVLRSNLLATIRDLQSSGQDRVALRHATQFVKATETAMENSAKRLPGNLYKEYQDISKFYRKGKDAFNNDIVATLLDKQPERVGESLFQSGNVSEIIQVKASLRQAARQQRSAAVKGLKDEAGNLIKETVDPLGTLNRLRAGYLNAMLTAKSATTKEGETVATNLLRELATAKTSRQFNVMFNSTQREAIDEFARTAFLAANNKPAQFSILAPLLQGATISLLLFGEPDTKETMSGIAMLSSPYILSRIMTNPKAVAVLTRGLKLPIGTSAGSSVVMKLAGEFKHWMENPPKESP